MKKVNFKVVLMALSFAFSFLFLGLEQLGAQTAQTTASISSVPGAPVSKGTAAVYALPQGAFVGNQEAQSAVLAKMMALKGDLAQITSESDPVFIATAREVRYYTAVYRALQAGNTVPQAIVAGLLAFPDYEGMSNSQLLGLKNLAIALLD